MRQNIGLFRIMERQFTLRALRIRNLIIYGRLQGKRRLFHTAAAASARSHFCFAGLLHLAAAAATAHATGALKGDRPGQEKKPQPGSNYRFCYSDHRHLSLIPDFDRSGSRLIYISIIGRATTKCYRGKFYGVMSRYFSSSICRYRPRSKSM